MRKLGISKAQQDLSWARWCGVLIFFVSLLMAVQITRASVLDDKIEAFKKAPDQTQTAVLEILKFGIREHRCAKAFASVQGWLNANPTESQEIGRASCRERV